MFVIVAGRGLIIIARGILGLAIIFSFSAFFSYFFLRSYYLGSQVLELRIIILV
jgi:hypothetical protein